MKERARARDLRRPSCAYTEAPRSPWNERSRSGHDKMQMQSLDSKSPLGKREKSREKSRRYWSQRESRAISTRIFFPLELKGIWDIKHTYNSSK